MKVADIVVTDDALGTNGLTLAGPDAELFEIEDGAVYLRAGTLLDFESKSQLDVTVVLDDAAVGSTPDGTAAISIAIEDVNEPPTFELTDAITTLPEDLDTSARVPVAGVSISDDALGNNLLSLAGPDAGLFEIEAGTVYLRAGVSLDFETNSLLEFSIVLDDPATGASPDGTATLAITVENVNEPPVVDLTNRVASLPEDADTTIRIKVADIVVTDDALGTHLLSLAGTDAGLFEIKSGSLYLKAGTLLDFETHPQLDVTVTVDDVIVGATPDNGATFSIPIEDVNETPTAVDDGATTDEDNAVNIPFDAMLANDTDPDTADSLTVVSVDGTGTAGLVTLDPDTGHVVYDPNGQFESLAAGETAIDVFHYTIGDGHGGTSTAAVTVTVTGRDEVALIVGRWIFYNNSAFDGARSGQRRTIGDRPGQAGPAARPDGHRGQLHQLQPWHQRHHGRRRPACPPAGDSSRADRLRVQDRQQQRSGRLERRPAAAVDDRSARHGRGTARIG